MKGAKMEDGKRIFVAEWEFRYFGISKIWNFGTFQLQIFEKKNQRIFNTFRRLTTLHTLCIVRNSTRKPCKNVIEKKTK